MTSDRRKHSGTFGSPARVETAGNGLSITGLGAVAEAGLGAVAEDKGA
jgi:hypothetical protein